MTHVGNDIVDLDSPYVKGKSNDQRFIQRVLTDEEQQAVLTSPAPDTLLQVFWAAKETAYKSSVKIRPDVSSAPRNYQVSLERSESEESFSGSVITPQSTVFIKFTCQNNSIHCYGASSFQAKEEIVFAVDKLTGQTATNFSRSSAIVSRRVRTLAAEKIADLLTVPVDEITITRAGHRRNRPYPEVYLHKEKTDIGISLSHDGRFIACAFLFPQG